MRTSLKMSELKSSLVELSVNDGYAVRYLMEIFNTIFPSASFIFTKNGMSCSKLSGSDDVIGSFQLYSDKVSGYKYTFGEDQKTISIPLSKLFSLLKTITKKDALTMSYDSKRPDEYVITIVTPNGKRPSTCPISEEETEDLDADLVLLFKNKSPMTVVPSNFMSVTFSNLGKCGAKRVICTAYDNCIVFNAITAEGKVFSEEVVPPNSSHRDSKELFNVEIDMAHIKKLTKISHIAPRGDVRIHIDSLHKLLMINFPVLYYGEMSLFFAAKEH